MQLQELINSLLFEAEGAELDFKREQYVFEKADEREKSELLKDILAFSNAWRRADAFILIGVQESKGERAIVTGVSSQLDDSRIQEFVNSKTNKPINFSYTPLEFEGKQLALIRIPCQERPFFLKNNYGPLIKNTVYLRRGSSTAIALPDEIAKMGASVEGGSVRRPRLQAGLVDPRSRDSPSTSLKFCTTPLRTPPSNELPSFDYPEEFLPGTRVAIPTIGLANSDYYKELADYISFATALRPVQFGVSNTGTAVASDVKLVLELFDPARQFSVFHERKAPSRPEKDAISSRMDFGLRSSEPPDVKVSYIKEKWCITVSLRKIQAKDVAVSDNCVFIGTDQSGQLKFNAAIYSDDLSEPERNEVVIDFVVKPKEVSVDDLVQGRFAVMLGG